MAASRFFFSIPSSIPVQDPYEEVFSLFTTETPETPWTHNRSVSQQSTRLELELDFTPFTSPTASRPGSRPDSRSGLYFPAADSTLSTSGDSAANIERSGPGSMSGSEHVSSQDESLFTPPYPRSAASRVKSPTMRVPLGGRRPRTTTSATASMKAISSQSTSKKPVVIHQSLSTLSQPGQTGTVVWDSSILMAKFLLSIKGLTMGCYRANLSQRTHHADDQQIRVAQRRQIRMLEEQAEHLTVTSESALRAITTASEALPMDQQVKHLVDDDGDIDPICDGEEDMLVFDPEETTILELGSGCGLLGIVMAELCRDLLLTDQKPVLPLLVKNLRANLDKKHFDQDRSSVHIGASKSTSALGNASPNPSRQSGDSPGSTCSIMPCYIQVQELSWGQEIDQDLRRGVGVDYIVATDVIYNESIVPKLVRTLKDLCEIREHVRRENRQGCGSQQETLFASNRRKKGGHQGERRRLGRTKRILGRTVVLVAQELRTDYVHLSFLEELQQAGFQTVRMPKEMMDAGFQSGYVIYSCFLRS
ncbi:MAG: hypothetical protein J3Q66DRAFT_354063 [Benniella sp.]|nr:MAG: hypothetical protein J3Q66DRAFT_354063 [Benniella sp.]